MSAETGPGGEHHASTRRPRTTNTRPNAPIAIPATTLATRRPRSPSLRPATDEPVARIVNHVSVPIATHGGSTATVSVRDSPRPGTTAVNAAAHETIVSGLA